MLLDLVTPLNIILSIVFALVLVNVLKVTWLVLIPVYIIIACLIIVIDTYTKSPRGQREKAERDEQIRKVQAQLRKREEKEAAEAQIIRGKNYADNEAEEKAHREMLDTERSNLQNLDTDLAVIAIVELAKVEARLTVSVSLTDFPSIISPAVFAFNQFKNSVDFAVSVPLSENIKDTCLLYQILLECTQLKLTWLSNSWTVANSGINDSSELGKLISFVLPNETKDWGGQYSYDKVTQNLMTEASSKLVYLNELLQVIRQVSRDISASNSIARNTEDPFEKIAKLKKLKDDGILTESEFESKKKELLDRL